MGTSWHVGLPPFTPATSVVPTKVTFIYPFYENDRFLKRQIEHWSDYPADLRAHLTVIVVDDGSPGSGAAATLHGQRLTFPIRLFRIEEDVRWNWLAARNIGAYQAAPGWLLLTDMDHVVPEATLRSIVYGVHRTDTIYAFARMDHHGKPLHPHPNSWLITKAVYWSVGGYDETLSGLYGTDGDWRRRCAVTAPMAVKTHHLVRHEFVSDASTTRYRRKQPMDADVPKIIARRSPEWRPKVLSFPYTEVAC